MNERLGKIQILVVWMSFLIFNPFHSGEIIIKTSRTTMTKIRLDL